MMGGVVTVVLCVAYLVGLNHLLFRKWPPK